MGDQRRDPKDNFSQWCGVQRFLRFVLSFCWGSGVDIPFRVLKEERVMEESCAQKEKVK